MGRTDGKTRMRTHLNWPTAGRDVKPAGVKAVADAASSSSEIIVQM